MHTLPMCHLSSLDWMHTEGLTPHLIAILYVSKDLFEVNLKGNKDNEAC